MPISLDQFAQRLTDRSLVSCEELEEVLADSSLVGDPDGGPADAPPESCPAVLAVEVAPFAS